MSSPGFPTVRKNGCCDVVDGKSREGPFIAVDTSPSSSVEFPAVRPWPRRSEQETKRPFDSKARQHLLQFPAAGSSFPSKHHLMYARRSVLDANSSSESDTEDLFFNTFKSLKSPVERFSKRNQNKCLKQMKLRKPQESFLKSSVMSGHVTCLSGSPIYASTAL